MRDVTSWLPGVLLGFGAAGFVSGAQAQALPVPGTRNRDWALENTAPYAYREGSNELLTTSDRMPNALQSSVSSDGNHSYHWDAARQLAYEWPNHAGSVGPHTLVIVRDDRTGITYTYHRRAPRQAKRQWHCLSGAPK